MCNWLENTPKQINPSAVNLAKRHSSSVAVGAQKSTSSAARELILILIPGQELHCSVIDECCIFGRSGTSLSLLQSLLQFSTSCLHCVALMRHWPFVWLTMNWTAGLWDCGTLGLRDCWTAGQWDESTDGFMNCSL